ncbi:MAG: DUF2194 domain-containing protein [Nitrospinae bacterium]|nr:DUF2194 domain-containing protein [Nitrospinota bacterium]
MKNKYLKIILFAIACIMPFSARASKAPRIILALYDGTDYEDTKETSIHRMAEMPLNHLGLIVKYHDINKGLPSTDELDDIRGVLTWFQSDTMADPIGYLRWAEKVIESGKKFVIFGELGVYKDTKSRITPLTEINRLLEKLGLQLKENWTNVTYDVSFVYKDPYMIEFERPLTGVLPPFEQIATVVTEGKSYLIVRNGNDHETESHLIVIGAKGGYVAGGFTHYYEETLKQQKWYINPFEFFRLAFSTDDLPKPDTNTLAGRRIFYSHIDGDGWRNMSEIDKYKKSASLSAEVILKEIIEPFSDLPVTVAPIAGDIDPDWHGTQKSLQLAKKILSLPHVEAGSHTYSHPLDWGFFADGNPAKELPYLKYYPEYRYKGRNIFMGLIKADDKSKNTSDLWDEIKKSASEEEGHAEQDIIRYEIPRNYAIRPFDLKFEIDNSINFINGLLTQGKKVEILQWSGNTLAFEDAIAASRKAGVRNINGGDTRFDKEYPSYSWVAPLGRQVGKERQIYSSNSNENTYTDLWTDRFFGFKFLVKTIRNTETPWRIKPFNVYYHIYSGEKISSLNAVLDNLRYARTLEITPIATSTYAAIVDGFFSTQIISLGDKQWQIKNRDALQTIRFDRGTFYAVDFSRSDGIIGQRHYQGSLYVYLDESNSSPVIALKDNPDFDREPAAFRAYLVHSRWRIWNLQFNNRGFSFTAQGFGNGEMTWKVHKAGNYKIEINKDEGRYGKSKVSAGNDRILNLKLDYDAIKPVRITVLYE